MKSCKNRKRLGSLRGVLHACLSVAALFAGLLALQDASADTTEAARSPIVALGIDATNHVLLKATDKALYESADGGQRWTQIALPQANGQVAAIAASTQQPGLLYVAGPGLGIFRSENDGKSWSPRNDGLPDGNVETLTAHADQAGTVYAYVAGKGIFRSQNGGLKWRLMDRGPREPILRFVHSNMPGSMQTGWLFAATSKGVARSMDCFCGWRNAGGLSGNVNAVAYDPQQPQQIYAAMGAALLLSKNGGEQWAHLSAPGPVITALLVAPSGVLYTAGDGELFRSADQAKTWERLND